MLQNLSYFWNTKIIILEENEILNLHEKQNSTYVIFIFQHHLIKHKLHKGSLMNSMRTKSCHIFGSKWRPTVHLGYQTSTPTNQTKRVTSFNVTPYKLPVRYKETLVLIQDTRIHYIFSSNQDKIDFLENSWDLVCTLYILIFYSYFV